MLSIQNACKSFGGITVVNKVSLDVQPGEVHALLGANGAGKSTLVNILGGRFSDVGGSFSLNGIPLRLDSPAQALRQGIAIVHQDSDLVPGLTVAENIFLGRESPIGDGRSYLLADIGRKRLFERATDLLSHFGLNVDPKARVSDLSVAARQLTQIARALALNSDVVIFDEPTARLGETDRKLLFTIFERLRAARKMLIFVTHYLDEVIQIADRATIMRDGRWVNTVFVAHSSVTELSQMMVGKDVIHRERQRKSGVEAIAINLAKHRGQGFDPINLRVNRGEIVGLLGHPGSGRHELTRSIVENVRNSRGSGQLRVGFLPEDRRAEGIFPHFSVAENISVGLLGGIPLLCLRPRARERAAALQVVERLQVQTRGLDQRITELSGGNQQKVLFGRATIQAPDLYVIECPTVGVDVRAGAELHGLIGELADSGAGILLATDDLDEALLLADRILVLFRGRIAAEFTPENVTRQALVAAMGVF